MLASTLLVQTSNKANLSLQKPRMQCLPAKVSVISHVQYRTQGDSSILSK